MDEGWAVMLIFKYMENLTGFNSRLARNVAVYQELAGTEKDIPEIIPSFSQTYTAYRNSAYDRSSIAYEILRDVLGDKLFLEALQEYIQRWKGRHPTPYDFYFTFNEVTGQNLNWFWKPWFFEIGYPDLAIDNVTVNERKAELKIKKVGNIPVPINLTVSYENQADEKFYFTAEVWKDDIDIFVMELELSGILKEIKLGDINIPDSNRENNLYLVH
jgi:aminopeptidase N